MCLLNYAGELLVIVEFCRYGNLQDYLLANRRHFVNELDDDCNPKNICEKYASKWHACSNFPLMRFTTVLSGRIQRRRNPHWNSISMTLLLTKNQKIRQQMQDTGSPERIRWPVVRLSALTIWSAGPSKLPAEWIIWLNEKQDLYFFYFLGRRSEQFVLGIARGFGGAQCSASGWRYS